MVTAFTRPPPDHTEMCLQNGRLILAERLGVGSSSTVWLAVDRQPAFHAVKVLLPPSYLRLASGLEGSKNGTRPFQHPHPPPFLHRARPPLLPLRPLRRWFPGGRPRHPVLLEEGRQGQVGLVPAHRRPPTLSQSRRRPPRHQPRARPLLRRSTARLPHLLRSRKQRRLQRQLQDWKQAIYVSWYVFFIYTSRTPWNPQTSDIWSLGILLLQMLAGHPPWRVACEDKDQLYTFYLQFRAALLYDALPITQGAAALLSRILEPDPGQRITLAELRRELGAVGPLTVTEEELAYAPKIARQSYCARVSGLGVPYRVPPRHADLCDPPSYSERPPPLTRPPSYTDPDIPPCPTPGIPPYSLGSNTDLAWNHPPPSTSSNHSVASFPGLPRTSPYISLDNPASRSSLCISFTPEPEPSKQPSRLASMMNFLTGLTG